MLKLLFSIQRQIIPTLQVAMEKACKHNQSKIRWKIRRTFAEQERMVDHPLENIAALDKQAMLIYESIRDLLDLKQKHVNALEAVYAREQNKRTSQQGKMLLVFTIVTVIFLPLSFIAAFFAINVNEFPRNSDMTLPLDFVTEYMFGVGLPFAGLCVVAALVVGGFVVGPFNHVLGWASNKTQSPLARSPTMSKLPSVSDIKGAGSDSSASNMQQRMMQFRLRSKIYRDHDIERGR